jgi:hypothetical protein
MNRGVGVEVEEDAVPLRPRDGAGDLPEEPADLPDPVPAPSGTVYPQPTAISLNEE